MGNLLTTTKTKITIEKLNEYRRLEAENIDLKQRIAELEILLKIISRNHNRNHNELYNKEFYK